MNPIRFFTDEDVHGLVAGYLRNAGFDTVSAPEAARLAVDDEPQLEWASNQNRVIVTFNVGDFANLHCLWARANRNHSGIVVSPQPGELVRRLLRLAGALSAENMVNRLEFLSSWK